MYLRSLCLSISLLAVVLTSPKPARSLSLISDEASATANETAFSVPDGTQIPGKSLIAGSYSIRIVDRLSDRMILQVQGGGIGQTTILALPKSDLAASGPGPIFVRGGDNSKSAMRGFRFADGTVAEFVYPKAEAVSLAKANDSTFPAIDPESEGRAPATNLSKSDMEMVTLWMLSPTRVRPNDRGAEISAARYQQSKTAPVKKAPVVAMSALPHTAGVLPAILAAGLLSLQSAWLLAMRRKRQEHSL